MTGKLLQLNCWRLNLLESGLFNTKVHEVIGHPLRDLALSLTLIKFFTAKDKNGINCGKGLMGTPCL
jgi:hypothetical protein